VGIVAHLEDRSFAFQKQLEQFFDFQWAGFLRGDRKLHG